MVTKRRIGRYRLLHQGVHARSTAVLLDVVIVADRGSVRRPHKTSARTLSHQNNVGIVGRGLVACVVAQIEGVGAALLLAGRSRTGRAVGVSIVGVLHVTKASLYRAAASTASPEVLRVSGGLVEVSGTADTNLSIVNVSAA